jgi:crotonobetainyl-CoA:carnitine CoA-transferase CaiB-like acyl-CoA transferase
MGEIFMAKPLTGIRVLDLSRIIAGPFCTMQLGDMGAEIIKIEAPAGGDDLRSTPPFINGEGAYFILNNRNKKSITVNLKTEKGKEVFKRLVGISDVVVENFRPGVMEKLGLHYDVVKQLNPRIVYCSISGYGQEYKQGAYDPIVQGESGIMSVTGEVGGHPAKVGVPVGDLVASLYAVQGILLALRMREITGRGDYVEVSLMDTLVSLLGLPASVFIATGRNPQRVGNAHPGFTPYDLYQTADGYINIACGNNALWEKFCTAASLQELARDERYRSLKDRLKQRAELTKIIQEKMKTKTTKEWEGLFTAVGVPNGTIRTIEQVFDDVNLKGRGMINKRQHSVIGEYYDLGNPVKILSQQDICYSPPPRLGEHTREVLNLIGLNEEDIRGLSSAKAI